MVSKQIKSKLGIGLYSPAEAARLAKLRTQTFNRWFFGDAKSPAITKHQYAAESGDRIVTFADLMQAKAIKAIRSSPLGKGVSLQAVRELIKTLAARNIDFPLARNHKLLIGYDNQILIDIQEHGLIGTRGPDRHQQFHREILQPYLKEVEFGVEGLMRRWKAMDNGKFAVVLDRDLRFGQPIIEPGGILVSALVESARAEGSPEAAAEGFGIDPEAVRLALTFQEALEPAA